MKYIRGMGLTIFLAAMLFAMDRMLGRQVAYFAICFSALWFVIAFVLLTRPPGVPEFVSRETGSDEQYVVRRDLIPLLPLAERLRHALTVACGSCLLIWLSLSLMAR